MRRVSIYDTTLRDGTQGEEFNLSLEEKLRIAFRLDQFGVDYIEGGWPGSNPKDIAFFKEVRSYLFKSARIAAFGSTHHPANSPVADENLRMLIESRAPVVTIFGKTWKCHVTDCLKVTPERNLEIIRGSLALLRPAVETLFYDAEHFFDGFKDDKAYALKTLQAALDGGAECLVLCDTKGGTLTGELIEIIKEVRLAFPADISFGIHAHNDSEGAVQNSLAAVVLGFDQVQGTINGIGERCGNANLCSVIPSLALKMGMQVNCAENLEDLTELAHYVMEVANLPLGKYVPYVGKCAFSHKGGVHAAAVKISPAMYEHVDPAYIGNKRRFPASDLSGRATILKKAEQFGIKLEKENPVAQQVVKRIKDLENRGYQFEVAEASLELLIHEAMGQKKKYFELVEYDLMNNKHRKGAPVSKAMVRIEIGDFERFTVSRSKKGPINAITRSLREALKAAYPILESLKLVDYKVRVLPKREDTGSQVRVLLEFRNGKLSFNTIGVSHDIIEASWAGIVDGFNYMLFKNDI